MTDFKNTALEYASKYGFAVFPLMFKGKQPIHKGGFQNATTDLGQIEAWWDSNPYANIGIATGAMSGGLCVVDLDIDKDKGIDGRESLKEWESAHGKLPDTVCVTTGRGGEHLYFRTDKPFRSTRGVLEGVDVRCEGGYVVAPGSIHENGREYVWDYSPEDIDMASPNSSLLQLLERFDASETTAFSMPERVKEGARNDTLFKLASSLQAKGLPDGAIRAAVKTTNIEACEPPLTDEELEKEVLKGVLEKYEKGKLQKEIKPKKEIRKLQGVTVFDLHQMDLPPITFRVKDFIADGVVMLAAKSKFHKSWFALQLGIAVAEGNRFLKYPTTQCDVVYFDLENVMQITKDRIDLMKVGFPKNMTIYHECERLGSGFEEQLEEVLEANPNIGLVIIDVLQHIRFLKQPKETDYEADYRTISYFKALCSKRPLTIIFIHHSRKSEDDNDPFSNILGSTALMGASDQAIVFHAKSRADEFVTISSTGRTVQTVELKARFNKDTLNWENMGTLDDIESEDRRKKYDDNPIIKTIRALVADTGEWCGTSAELKKAAEEMKIYLDSPVSIGKDIKKLETELYMNDEIKFKLIRGRNNFMYKFLRVSTVSTVSTAKQ